MSENALPWIDIVPGIRRQTITAGTTMYQMRAELKAGSRLPEHHHPQEQIMHLVSGRLRVFAGGAEREMRAGESIYLASDMPHAVDVLEDSQVIDTFSPPRDDYLTLDRAAAGK